MVQVRRDACRVCGFGMRDVLELGNLVLSDFVDEDSEPPRAPLTLAECEACHLVQLRHTVDRDRLYRNYWYLSGLNASMVESLGDVVAGVESRVDLEPGDWVVDVGANDGTLLRLYRESWLYKVGFDPAKNVAELASEKCDLFVNDYFETSDVTLPAVKVVTSIAMFYDLDEPHKFAAKVAEILHPRGVWVIQLTDLVRMLRANAVDNICHEHLCYYSVSSLSSLVEQHGLRIFDMEFNDVNGGSLRAYVGRVGEREPSPTVARALRDEADYLTPGAMTEFEARVTRSKNALVEFVLTRRNMGERFHALGASTKGNTLLQFFGLSRNEIECAAEINPAKFGKFTAGTSIPIVGDSESLALRPDFYLVLPWHFMPFLLRKYADYVFSGGQLLAPLPTPTVHSYERHLA